MQKLSIVYLLRALKALGLINLNFYTISIRGVRGKRRVEEIIRGDRSGIGLMCFSCQLILVLLDVGNIVIEMEYVRRM